MNKPDIAVNDIFKKGFNCAQSVFTAFSDDFGIDKETALRISGGFGGGMGRLQLTCGAVTGAFMVLGLKYGQVKPEDSAAKEKVYSEIQKFAKEFTAINKTTSCFELLNCDLKTEEGKLFFKDNDLHNKICAKCVKDAVLILEKMLKS
jgi:C_GCAxxG_C_C family probable redox protein